MNPKYTSFIFVSDSLDFHTKYSMEEKAIGLILHTGKLRLGAAQ